MNGGWGISHEITLRWMPLDLTYDKSKLVQVMAWCRQATSHYLSWANVVLNPCRHMTSIGYNELRESTLSWHWDNRVTPSPWAELRHLCLSGDQTCYSCKMLSWMFRRTCGGMSASASSWECSFVGLRGLIVSVTHHHYIDSISFKMFQDMSEIRKLVLCWYAR